uniref:Uncharacterized protein n=1 Tax=Rhizophora mucronata TaxID=61149 RepID=A0A2P2QKP9_RHIMU
MKTTLLIHRAQSQKGFEQCIVRRTKKCAT